MSDMATAIELEIGLPVRPISVEDYHRMAEAGIFDEHERVELLDGMLISMPPIGPHHAYSVRYLNNMFTRHLRECVVDVQNPLNLGPRSEPQPDIVLLPMPFTRYAGRLPVPDDALLVVEVAETSLSYDLGPKLRAYARAGVVELWIVNLVNRRIESYRNPADNAYHERAVAYPGEHVAPAAFPDERLAVADILPPVTR